MDSPEEVWSNLTDVEATAVQVCLARWRAAPFPPPKNAAAMLGFDGSFDAAILELAMPKSEQSKIVMSLDQRGMMAVRTASIDDQLLALMAEGDAEGGVPLRQVVILGAGLDCRAGRPAWPTGTTVYEVDSGAVEQLKLRSLGRFPLRCRRVFLTADLGRPGELAGQMGQAGHVAEEPTLWLLEGLIGYLTRPQGAQLFKAMARLSAPGSRILMTAPPTQGQTKAALREEGRKLHHVTMEPARATLNRLHRHGWRGSIRPGQALAERYGVMAYPQDQIYAQRATHARGQGCAVM